MLKCPTTPPSNPSQLPTVTLLPLCACVFPVHWIMTQLRYNQGVQRPTKVYKGLNGHKRHETSPKSS
jgi:hypothetical protein